MEPSVWVAAHAMVDRPGLAAGPLLAPVAIAAEGVEQPVDTDGFSGRQPLVACDAVLGAAAVDEIVMAGRAPYAGMIAVGKACVIDRRNAQACETQIGQRSNGKHGRRTGPQHESRNQGQDMFLAVNATCQEHDDAARTEEDNGNFSSGYERDMRSSRHAGDDTGDTMKTWSRQKTKAQAQSLGSPYGQGRHEGGRSPKPKNDLDGNGGRQPLPQFWFRCGRQEKMSA